MKLIYNREQRKAVSTMRNHFPTDHHYMNRSDLIEIKED
jgi:hypothetical protein